MSHTLLLIQRTKNPASRTFTDHESVQLAVESVIKSYEQRLQDLNPNVRQITYDVKDLQQYIDHLGEIVALVFDQNVKAYVPHDRDWLKKRVMMHLKQAAN